MDTVRPTLTKPDNMDSTRSAVVRALRARIRARMSSRTSSTDKLGVASKSASRRASSKSAASSARKSAVTAQGNEETRVRCIRHEDSLASSSSAAGSDRWPFPDSGLGVALKGAWLAGNATGDGQARCADDVASEVTKFTEAAIQTPARKFRTAGRSRESIISRGLSDPVQNSTLLGTPGCPVRLSV